MSFFNILKNIQPVTDSDEQLRHHILWFIFIRVILYTLLLGITILLQSRERQVILPPLFFILTFLVSVYGYSIGSALILHKKNLRIRRFGLIQLLSDTLFIALLVYATGCSQSIFTSVFILPTIAGGLILYRVGGLIPASASTLLYGSVLTLEYLRIIPSYFLDFRYNVVEDFQVSMNIFAVFGLTLFLIAILSSIIAVRLRTTEDALSQTELKFDRLLLLYKQIFDNIVTGIITLDDNGGITSFNPAASGITGYSPDEVSGRKLSDIFPQIQTENQNRHVTNFKVKDGNMIRLGYSCSELRMSSSKPLLNEPTYTNCKVITLQDISQIEKMEQQVRNAEKMAAIGKMSASVAHDFRNPLAAISGSAQLLSMEINETDNNRNSTQNDLMNIILRESDRMARTITDFLHYARPVTLDLEWFNLKSLADETGETISNNADGCDINVTIPEDVDIFCDKQQIQIALTHLLKNSCHASQQTTEPVEITAGLATDNNREYIIVEVIDKGVGIDPAIRDRLFEPFFTTREDTAGLGLVIVQQVIASHKGKLEIISQPGQGCTVRMRLPMP